MKKILAIILLPLLMALPVSEGCNVFFSGSNCQDAVEVEKDSCCCVDTPIRPSNLAENSCCCEISNSQDSVSQPILLNLKTIEINSITDFEFTKPFDLTKKLNIIEDYFAYLSAGISISEKFVFYSPPIYQQYCSLRI